MKRGATLCAGLVTINSGTACSRDVSPVSRPNVLIIMVDTLRYDRLGAYEKTRQLTPFTDSLAERGYVFERAYASSSWTNPSVASLFTSRHQSQHHVISFGSVLSPDELTLAEILKGHGYATAAFCANILVNSTLGFDQGFDRFKVVSRRGAPDSFPRFLKGRADAVNREALTWLDSIRTDGDHAPFFLYVHYMEPHAPFDPPDEILAKVLDGRPRADLEEVNKAMNFAVVNFPEELVGPAQDFYDAEIMSLDVQLKDLFAQLQSRGLLDDTIVVFVADHGEEFNEHGLVGHHHTLYEEVIRVPFLLVVPGRDGHGEIPEPVSLLDIPPTLLDLAGLPAEGTFEGRSLTYLLEGRDSWRSKLWSLFDDEKAPVFSELIKAKETVRRSPHERAVVLDLDKLIVGVEGSREYYDLAKDPNEKHPEATSPDGNALDSALQTLYADGAGRGTPKKGSLDPETRERMRALGYDE